MNIKNWKELFLWANNWWDRKPETETPERTATPIIVVCPSRIQFNLMLQETGDFIENFFVLIRNIEDIQDHNNLDNARFYTVYGNYTNSKNCIELIQFLKNNGMIFLPYEPSKIQRMKEAI